MDSQANEKENMNKEFKVRFLDFRFIFISSIIFESEKMGYFLCRN